MQARFGRRIRRPAVIAIGGIALAVTMISIASALFARLL